ncbi:hypothetical protein WA026_008202 [Henosepilachna vigintioctopunctata]|uniref:C2H2-type domain-containing protein n=1 Tax=Henosepilachna vigintioctopunctata TaxID=420089 RepID=A0AAW1TKM5_9CUCU
MGRERIPDCIAMVDNDVDSLICNTAQIRGEEEKDTFKSECNSSGCDSFSSSSTKSSCKSGSSDDIYLDKVGSHYREDEVAVDTITIKPSKTSLFCSVPLNRIGAVLGYNSNKIDTGETSSMKIKQISRKLLCLYCDRTFVSSNLRQKHVERCHSEKQSRRLSSRKLQSQFTTTACCYCDKLPAEHSLRQLFDHLISDHSERYFGCLSCEERFLNLSLLNDHNANVHSDFSMQRRQKTSRLIEIEKDLEKSDTISDQKDDNYKESNQKLTRSMTKDKDTHPHIKPSLRQLRNKKIAIKASKIGLKRSKRLQAAQAKVQVRKKRTSTFESMKLEETTSKPPEKAKNPSVNPYPEFDNNYRVKKITDHSIDNLKISSLTFDDVFDKAFFSRIKCNIQENLMYHLDGKLFKNEESENRISNFEKNPPPQDVPSTSSENFGCDLTLNALTPVTSILTPHFGEDLESQIEYGSKPSKKKLQPRQDPVRHKYVTRRKYQASILEHKENRDLSKLDMWTQLIIKDRQQKVMNDQKSAKEMLEYTTCEEYKLKVQRNELNRILDRRGPFEDLREEASKKAALDNLNSEFANQISEECFKEVRSLMDDLLNEVVKVSSDNGDNSDNIVKLEEEEYFLDKVDIPEFPEYLKLQRASSVLNEEEIDKSDKIALICSSQETENYELPTNKVRAKNEMVELSGEWARSRIYVCAACGLKLPNMKILLEHKTLDHQYAWVQHYELVGNQSKLYRHLCIPGLGKVGHVEDTVQCKIWRRSEARVCTKCGKVCNALGELHRHILECGGDWTWMLARKKCKYRPFGSRKKRRGLVKRIRERNQKTEQTEKKIYKKRFEGPRQRPSDADTIQRMLANLPPKRSSRKSICMKDGFPRNLNKNQNSEKQVMKCGKIVMKKSTYNSSESKEVKSTTTHKRTLRSLNRTLSCKILDTTNKLRVKRQLMKNIRRSTRKTTAISASNEDKKVISEDEELKDSSVKIAKGGKVKNGNGKNCITNILQEKLNIKSFFPVSKRKLSKNNNMNNICDPQNADSSKEKIISEEKKSKGSIKKLLKKSLNFKKKTATKCESADELRVSSEPIVVIEKLQQSAQKTTKATSNLSSKRKLRSSFRKVIDKVKKLKIDNTSSALSSGQNKPTTVKSLNSFLGQGPKEKEKLPKVLVPLVEEPKENPPSTPAFVQNVMNSNSPTEESLIPENIFNLEHNSENLLQAKSPLENPLNELRNNEAKNAFETFAAMKECAVESDKKHEIIAEAKSSTVAVQSSNSSSNVSSEERSSKEMSLLSIETNVKSDKSPLNSPVLSPSALSPKMKGRLRKPNRGLNDCIAMLTKKAFEVTTYKSDGSTNENFSQTQDENPILDNKNVAHKFVRPNECILKIPVFETESNKNVQSEVLDLSKPKQKIKEERALLSKIQLIYQH